MFIVRWRNRSRSMIIVTGLRRYVTRKNADAQVVLFKRHFPANSYYVEKID